MKDVLDWECQRFLRRGAETFLTDYWRSSGRKLIRYAKTKPAKRSRRGLRPFVAVDVRDLTGPDLGGPPGHRSFSGPCWQHFGAGARGKPIIDIDAIVPSRAEMPATIERLASLGYVHSGNLGIEDREAFESPAGLPTHHLYACVQGSVALANHLAVRDCLRRNPSAAAAYGQLKKQLAEEFPTDIERYVVGKTDFLLQILRTAGFADAALLAIRDANRRK